MALSVLSVGLLAIAIIFAFIHTGERPLYDRLMEKIRGEGTIILAPEVSQVTPAQDEHEQRS